MNTNKTALVYMIAGISRRFDGRIKSLAKVGPKGETFLECSLKQALKANFDKIIFIVNERTEKAFRRKFGNSFKGIPIYYAIQEFDKRIRDNPWGTADAVCSAKTFLDCPFVVCTGDDLYGSENFIKLAEHFKKSEEEATISYLLKKTIPKEGKVKRAILEIEEGYVKRISDAFSVSPKDETKKDEQCCMTIFALHPKILTLLKNRVDEFKEKNKNNRKAELPLHKALSQIIEAGKIRMRRYVSKEKWIGITNPKDEKIVKELLSKHM